MTSKFWIKGCKFSSVVSMTFGLLMPGLPLLAATPFSNLAEDSSSASSEELLIAQESCTAVEQFSTDSYLIEIYSCNGEISYLDSTNLYNGVTTSVYDIMVNTSEYYYEGTTYDEDGNELTYIVGDYLQIFNNGDQIVYEQAF